MMVSVQERCIEVGKFERLFGGMVFKKFLSCPVGSTSIKTPSAQAVVSIFHVSVLC